MSAVQRSKIRDRPASERQGEKASLREKGGANASRVDPADCAASYNSAILIRPSLNNASTLIALRRVFVPDVNWCGSARTWGKS